MPKKVMNIMICLKNIRIENNIASAEFFPEKSETGGEIVVDLLTEEVIKLQTIQGYGDSYHGHAKWKLIDMARDGDNRRECVVMWC